MGRDRNDVDQQHHQDSLSELSNPNITPARISDSASRHHAGLNPLITRIPILTITALNGGEKNVSLATPLRKRIPPRTPTPIPMRRVAGAGGGSEGRERVRRSPSSSRRRRVGSVGGGSGGCGGVRRRRRRGKRKSRRRDSESESEDERRRRKRRERRKREEERERKRRKREKEKKRRKKEKKKERGKKGAVTDSWGKYGTVKETDMWNKRPEFTAWLAEVKQVNLEALSNWEEKKMFKEYMEDYNTATFPSKKYYNLDAYHRRKMEKEQKKGFTKVLESVRTVFNDEEQRRQEMLRVREKQKEQEVEALKHSMQSGLAQAMKEQQRLREEMAYQYKIGNFEAAAAIQRRLDPDAAM